MSLDHCIFLASVGAMVSFGAGLSIAERNPKRFKILLGAGVALFYVSAILVAFIDAPASVRF